MAYKRVLIMDGKLVIGDSEFYLLNEDGTFAERFNFQGDVWWEGDYLSFGVGQGVRAYKIGAQTLESAAYAAGQLHAQKQKTRRMPKRAETDRHFYFGWTDEWKKKKEAK